MNGFGGGVFAGRKPTVNSPQNAASLDYLLKWINQGFLPAEPLAPVIALVLLSFVLGERRSLLAAAAALLLVLALFFYGRYAVDVLKAERRASAQEVATHVASEAKKAEALLADLKTPACQPLAPTLWDVDLYRQSRGLIDASGAPDEGRLGELSHVDAGRMTRSVALLALLSLVLLAFVGLGWAARTGTALVEYRTAYAYALPALIGMLFLVFFPFFYGVALSFTNANLYNTDKSVFETWTGLSNYVDIVSDFHVVKRTAEGLAWNYQNFYYTLLFTIAWTVSNVAIGVSLGLTLALILNLQGFALRPLSAGLAERLRAVVPWPAHLSLSNFQSLFADQPFARWMLNSVVVAALATTPPSR